VLTDNGIQFADLSKNRGGLTARWRGHPFDTPPLTSRTGLPNWKKNDAVGNGLIDARRAGCVAMVAVCHDVLLSCAARVGRDSEGGLFAFGSQPIASVASWHRPPSDPTQPSLDQRTGQRMNRTIKQATVKRFFYDTHEQLKAHLSDFIAA
jgi:hypothetical protein